MLLRGGVNMSCTLFPLTNVLSHSVFLIRFLIRWHDMYIIGKCTLFLSLSFFFCEFFYLDKVLARYIIY